MSPSSPCMKEYGLDIQNKFKISKDLHIFPKIIKTHQKMQQISEETSGIRKLFASLDIHYNKILNITAIQKQNES